MMADGDGPKFGRRFLASAALSAIGTRAVAADDPAIVETQDWGRYLGDGVERFPYGMPSPHEKHVVRRHVEWLTAGTQSSVNFTPLHELEGIVTPNGLCFERHHAGIADIEPDKHRLMIHGLVDRPLVLTMADIKRLPRANGLYFLECAANSGMEWRGAQLNGCQYTHGMVHNVMYTGVSLRTLFDAVGVKPAGTWVMAEGADAAGMNRSLPMAKALDDCMVAFAMNGEALRPENGYPLRLVVPGWQGNLWVKWLRRLKIDNQPWMTREETSKYTDLMGDGRARRFTYAMDAKSVITSPSPQCAPAKKGPLPISGLAWSGRGQIVAVDVSVDGGRNWRAIRATSVPTASPLARRSMPASSPSTARRVS